MQDEIIALIKSEIPLSELKEKLSNYKPYDIALAFQSLDDVNKQKIIDIYDNTELAEILSYGDIDDSADVLEDLPNEKAAAIINEMELDDAADILEELEDDVADKVSELLPQDTKKDLEILTNYEEGTAGSIMNPAFIKVPENTTVKQALKLVTAQASDVENINTIFVVDDNGYLKGTMDLKKLICARMPKTVNDVMMENFAYVNVEDDHATIVKKVKDYDVLNLPVLDNGVIKGIITMDDTFDVLNDEAEEDYAKLAGLVEDETKEETILGSVKKRIPWLAILLVLDVFIALVIAKFDEVIEKLTILTFFQAAVLGLAGNCGTQSLAVSVRKIADGEADKKGAVRRHVFREVAQGAGTGLILGVVSFIFIVCMLYIKKETTISPYQIGLVVAIAIFVAVVLANFCGSLLPVIFYKLHIDPAVASGPFITTLNDIVAVVTYFGIAMIILHKFL